MFRNPQVGVKVFMADGKSIKAGSSLDCKLVTGATEKSSAIVLCTLSEPAKKIITKSFWTQYGE